MRRLIFLISVLYISGFLYGQKYNLTSPDNNLKGLIEINKRIHLTLTSGEKTLFKLGNISLETYGNSNPEAVLRVKKINRRSVDEIVWPEIREKAESFIYRYNELEIILSGSQSVTFRMFDEGLAYRFSTTAKDSLIVFSENLSLYFDKKDSARFQSTPTFNSSYETPYEHMAVDEIEKEKLCSMPFLVQKENGTFILISEADLFNYPGLWLKNSEEKVLSAINPPYPKRLSYSGSLYNHGQVDQTFDYIAKVKGTRNYPWRIFAVAANEKEIVENNMVYLLSSQCAVKDISWIKPGVVMFDWWGKNNIYGVDFKAGINTETAKYFIDFCAEHGFRYFLFDDGWCVNQDLLKPVPGLDLDEVISYAESKNVDIMLWILWNSLQKQWDEAFAQFQKWGIKGIKIDFMNRDDQPMVEFYEAAASKAAGQKLIVDFHGAYKPCGLSRKYPNVLTREALIEFEYNGWTQYDNPVHHNLLPYIRMFTGPMDYIPATMRNSTRDNFRPIGDYPMGQGTRAHAMAMFVIVNSPLTMLPDSPSDYYREKECTQFLKGIPVIWDESILLEGKIAEYTVMARRSGEDWYVGAITSWDKRSIELKTDFLGSGRFEIEAIE
ncbi:MAG: glycoside hydrolase family 97 protein, partial [Bacteroidia bacterium]|nr:glycoside hydrolase family 97 protein [Bacteroidia bacterium]